MLQTGARLDRQLLSVASVKRRLSSFKKFVVLKLMGPNEG